MNSVQLVGRLTREVELRFTQSGVAVGTFTLAVNRNFTNQQGEREADFIRCVIWRKSAENFANFTRKGSLVGVEGRIQTRSYDNERGERVYMTEVVVDQFHLLESRATTEQRPKEDNANQGGNTNHYGGGSDNYGYGSAPNNYASQQNDNNFARNDQAKSSGQSPFDQDFGNFQNYSNPFEEDFSNTDISQDDLPF